MTPDYQTIFKTLPGPFLLLDTSFNILEATDAFLDVTFKKREELIKQEYFTVFPDNTQHPEEDGASGIRESFAHVLKYKQSHMQESQRRVMPADSGSRSNITTYRRSYNSPVIDNGEVILIIHKVEDMTSYMHVQQGNRKLSAENSAMKHTIDLMQREMVKRSQDVENTTRQLRDTLDKLTRKSIELERSNLELSNFAMIAAHDLKAPFRVVGRYLEAIEERLPPDEKERMREFFEPINLARERISSLLDDLLDFAMVSTADQFRGEIHIQQTLKDALDNLETVIADRNAVIEVPEGLPVLYGERGPLVHVWQNLIENAIKFNKGKPVIKIKYEKRGEGHLFSVADNGVGINNEYFPQLFEVFRRLHSKDEFPGTGLGLAMCKRIVERHRGQIWIESEPGKGSIFYFTLKVILESQD